MLFIYLFYYCKQNSNMYTNIDYIKTIFGYKPVTYDYIIFNESVFLKVFLRKSPIKFLSKK